MTDIFPPSMLLVGCGAMAGAMLHRWLDVGLDPARVRVARPSGAAVAPGVAVSQRIEGPAPALLLLGCKPAALDAVADDVAAVVDGTSIVVSILAGVEVAALRARFPRVGAVVRAMPNLPVRHGAGVVALHGEANAAVATVARLMTPLGLVETIADEARFDAVTALAGSGPAFLYRFVDALAAGGAALGLDPGQAMRLARATVTGAAAAVAADPRAPGDLADAVASKGGSTRRGLDVLDADEALGRLVARTLAAAEARNREMAAAARGDPPGPVDGPGRAV